MNKNAYKISFILVLFFIGSIRPVSAISLGKFLGTGKVIYNSISDFIGKTEVTPAYSLYYWKKIRWGYYSSVPFRTIHYIHRSPVTGYIFYQIFILDPHDNSFSENREPFAVYNMSRRNYRCDSSNSSKLFVVNEVENFALAVWVDSLKKSGQLPPKAPYTAWIKTQGTRVSETCNSPAWESRVFRSDVKLYDTGTSLLQPGWVGYRYNWPMLCWVGDVYDY